MTATSGIVVRCSALDAVHVALGARWVSEIVRWPEGYGTAAAAAEAPAVTAGAGLAEIGPFDELLLRGPGALAAASGITTDGSATVGRVMAADLRGEPCTLWMLGSDEVLLVTAIDGSGLGRLAIDLTSPDVSAIEMTGARTTLRIAGPAATVILAELCPVDTTPRSMPPWTVIQAPLAGVRAFIARQDTAGATGYTIMVARDEAAYVWDSLRHVGAAFALIPVGPAAVAPATSPPRGDP